MMTMITMLMIREHRLEIKTRDHRSETIDRTGQGTGPGLLGVRVPKGTYGYLSLRQGTSYLGNPGLLGGRVPTGT